MSKAEEIAASALNCLYGGIFEKGDRQMLEAVANKALEWAAQQCEEGQGNVSQGHFFAERIRAGKSNP